MNTTELEHAMARLHVDNINARRAAHTAILMLNTALDELRYGNLDTDREFIERIIDNTIAHLIHTSK